MARRNRKKLFEELGLLNDKPQENPFEVLGLDLKFASELLKDDPDGVALRVATSGLHRALAKIRHPDAGGDTGEYQKVKDAYDKIEAASPSLLRQWTRQERSQSSEQLRKKLQVERELFIDQTTDLIQRNLELGGHPKHFSRLEWSQGVLLQRASTSLLMQQVEGGLRVLRGRAATQSGGEAADFESQVFDFQSFLRQHESFGIEPGTRIVTFIDENGRASILHPDLTFMMDITDPVEERRKKRNNLPHHERVRIWGSDAWSRWADPLIFITDTPTNDTPPSVNQIVTFPKKAGGRNVAWEISMEVAGTVEDAGFFNRMKHTRTIGAAAITGSSTRRTSNYFNLAAAKTRALIEEDTGYSPLLKEGGSLLLFDTTTGVPVATDTKVIGMIGSDAKAA